MNVRRVVRESAFALLLAADVSTVRAQGIWTMTGPLNVARINPETTMLSDGRVLAATGRGGAAMLSAEIYDPGSGTWSFTGGLNAGHDKGTATLLNNGQVLLAGGSTSASEIYDPAGDVWSLTTPMIIDRADHTATLLPDGRVLVVGGSTFADAVGNTLSAEIYDPATGNWTLTSPMNIWRIGGHKATLLTDGTVLVTGGYTRYGPETITTTAEIYDPVTNSWSLTGDMAAPRTYHTATLLQDGTVLIAGGYNFPGPPGFVYVLQSEVYDPATGEWTPNAMMNDARSYHTATLLNDGSVLAAGGFNYKDDPAGRTLETAEIYDPPTGAWIPTASMNLARWMHSAILMSDGTVLVIAGNPDPRTELYIPQQ